MQFDDSFSFMLVSLQRLLPAWLVCRHAFTVLQSRLVSESGNSDFDCA